MSKTSRLILASLVLFFGIAAVLMKDRLIWSSRRESFETQREAQREADRSILFARDNRDSTSLYGALIRVSLNPGEDIRKRVLELVGSSDVRVRAGVAFFLSGQKGSAEIDALKKLMKDPESMVRTHIARGFNHHAGPDRAPLIREFLSVAVMEDADRVQAFSALFRSQTARAEQDVSLQTIVDFAKQEKNPDLAQWALLELCNLAPQDSRVIDLLRKAIQKKQKVVTPIAIRTLAVRRDAWLQETIEKWIFDSDPEIKRSGVDSLLFLCPVNRWTLIEKGFREAKDLREKKEVWLAQAERMPGKEAAEFYQKLLDGLKDKSPPEFSEIRASWARMQESKVKDPCAKVK